MSTRAATDPTTAGNRPSAAARDLPALAFLRHATDDLHQRLHRHPLINGLLTAPSMDAYRAVLSAFLRFYQVVEPELVAGCRRGGVDDQYPREERTAWLRADLEASGGTSEPTAREPVVAVTPIADTPTVVGWLYVVRGSALGGKTIAAELEPALDLRHCRRYFTADGDRAVRRWRAFQGFCEAACHRDAERQQAAAAARAAFFSIGDALTGAMSDRQS